MAENSKIEWTDATWNPIIGCSIVSPGCTNCYAMRMAARIENMAPPSKTGPVTHYAGTTKMVNGNRVWTGKIALAPDKILRAPFGWKKPKRVFVNSMGDLFHESIADESIDRVFAVMALCPQHVFQVLTKRAARMQEYCSSLQSRAVEIAQRAVWLGIWDDPDAAACDTVAAIDNGPLPNVWLGVSTERQQEADERIPMLLQTPSAIRFISAEPLLGPINLARINIKDRGWQDALSGWRNCKDYPGREELLDWVIVGGESGPHARLMEKPWAESLRDQCKNANVPFFFKQMAKKAPIPPDLQIREFPR